MKGNQNVELPVAQYMTSQNFKNVNKIIDHPTVNISKYTKSYHIFWQKTPPGHEWMKMTCMSCYDLWKNIIDQVPFWCTGTTQANFHSLGINPVLYDNVKRNENVWHRRSIEMKMNGFRRKVFTWLESRCKVWPIPMSSDTWKVFDKKWTC